MKRETLILHTLRAWRDETARRQGVEGYRILPNATLQAIAELGPTTLESLQTVKGIKAVKSRLYGKELLALVAQALHDLDPIRSDLDERAQRGGNERREIVENAREDSMDAASSPGSPLSISQFLDGLKLELSGMAARIKGEVTSVDIRERVVYFALKDKEDESVLNCLIFRSHYVVAGVNLIIGDEVIVEGAPDIYKPSGRLSLRALTIEYAGEGALKKAYDALYAKLEQAGVFALANKRPCPSLPERIALITSQEGAALGDFTMNLARVGLQVHLYPTLVEGKKAVFEIMRAIEYFNHHPERYDMLVLIRGGGSLESLQAFNSEALVNAVRNSRLPVLAGIGHERDVSLVALAADAMVSTPTATARYLSASWDEARQAVRRETVTLGGLAERIVMELRRTLVMREQILHGQMEVIFEQVQTVQQRFREQIFQMPGVFKAVSERLGLYFPYWKTAYEGGLRQTRGLLLDAGARLEQYDPHRALRLGYSLVHKEGKIVREASAVSVGDKLHIQLGRGTVQSTVSGIIEA